MSQQHNIKSKSCTADQNLTFALFDKLHSPPVTIRITSTSSSRISHKLSAFLFLFLTFLLQTALHINSISSWLSSMFVLVQEHMIIGGICGVDSRLSHTKKSVPVCGNNLYVINPVFTGFSSSSGSFKVLDKHWKKTQAAGQKLEFFSNTEICLPSMFIWNGTRHTVQNPHFILHLHHIRQRKALSHHQEARNNEVLAFKKKSVQP